jgi:uncharacterized membrane protein
MKTGAYDAVERRHEGHDMNESTETTTTSPTDAGAAGPRPPAPPATATPPPGWDAGWSRRRPRDNGGVFFGVLLLLIGGYFLLRDTLQIRLPSFGELWPILLIALGLWIVLSAMRRSDRL